MIYERTIKLGGNDYKVKASMGVFVRYETNFGKSLSEVMSDEKQVSSVSFFFELIYSAISSPKISFDDFCDTISSDELQTVIETSADLIKRLMPDEAQNTALKN